jgi:hypothetical protein
MSYISREELLKKEKYLDDWNIDLSYVDIEDVKSIPSADVRENIHGEWTPTQRGKFIDIICSNCGYVGIESYSMGYEVEELDKPELIKYIAECEMNFCERCGADMKGDKE